MKSVRSISFFLVLALAGLSGCDLSGLRAGGLLDNEDVNQRTVQTQYYAESSNTFRVRFQHPTGLYDVTLTCPDDIYLYDCLYNNGINHSISDGTGASSTDAVQVLSGTVDQSDQSFLDDDQIEAGFALISVAYPMSNLHILTEQEEALY